MATFAMTRADVAPLENPTLGARTMPPQLELAGVFKSFTSNGVKHMVLSNIDLKVKTGEFVAVLGRSGSGKTTLISLIAGLYPPDAGTMAVCGRPLTGPGPDRGVVFQNYSLLPWLNVRDNIALAVNQVFPDWSSERKREHIDRHLTMVNLTAAAAKKPSELSGGMRQRVSVARALAMDPEVLLLDEPFGALDALTRATLQRELESIWLEKQKTVLMITNDVDEAILLADRIIPLSSGPAATLGPSIPVELPRPRERRTLGSFERYYEIRKELDAFLRATKKGVTPAPPPSIRQQAQDPMTGAITPGIEV